MSITSQPQVVAPANFGAHVSRMVKTPQTMCVLIVAVGKNATVDKRVIDWCGSSV